MAEEVRNLASKSTEAVSDTGTLIGKSIQDVKTGTESTNLAISAMQVINECIQSNSEAAEESAAISTQLSNQSKTLNHLISQFRIR